MTPAEMREAAAALVERCEWYATASLGRLAAAIRALPLAEEAPPSLAAVLAALPHLTGDEVRRVAEALPRVAGEWTTSPSGNFWRVYDDAVEGGPDLAAAVGGDGESHEAITYIDGVRVRTTHPTARAAQAACDTRLEAAGVRLCGEVVRDG